MSKVQLSLNDWFTRAVKSGRDFLTVPPHITVLPCGHTRSQAEPEFCLRRVRDGWVHHFTLRCQEEPLPLPEASPDPAIVEKRVEKVRNTEILPRVFGIVN